MGGGKSKSANLVEIGMDWKGGAVVLLWASDEIGMDILHLHIFLAHAILALLLSSCVFKAVNIFLFFGVVSCRFLTVSDQDGVFKCSIFGVDYILIWLFRFFWVMGRY